MGKKTKIKRSTSDIVFDSVNYSLLIILGILTLIPFMQVITISLSDSEVFMKTGLHLIPTKISLEGYRRVFKYPLIWSAYGNTIIRTVVGTIISLFLYVLAAYPLSKLYLPNRRLWTVFIIFTMYFGGGLIPQYLLQANTLHMKDTWAVLILPMAINAYNLIIVRNFFMGIPESLMESAKIDGASDPYILRKIVLPLSKPILATVALWSAVGYWNEWFDYLLYISKDELYGLQYVLRRILLEGTMQELEMFSNTDQVVVSTETMKMAMLVVSIVPIVCVYPFVQQYFVKGVRIGAVKG